MIDREIAGVCVFQPGLERFLGRGRSASAFLLGRGPLRTAAVGRAAVGGVWTHLGQSTRPRGRCWSFVFEKLEDLL